MSQSAAQAAEFPDDEDIAVAQRPEAGPETWAIITGTGRAVLVNLVFRDTGLTQGVALQVERLQAICL